ncbi:MAG: heme ABC transporter ATP-binding protein [Opitutales bacterium]|nr:heme ABC transporter ATP-binding protein [Opitutales bacterium]
MSLRSDSISVIRGGRAILDGISVELEPARLTAVMGPNGAGKSSLRKILSGEWPPDKGTVYLDNTPLHSLPPAVLARRRAVLPQEPRLGFPFSIEEVVRIGRYPWRGLATPEEDDTAVANALRAVGLAAPPDALYTRLSGGEKQRLHLARILAQLDRPAAAESLPCFLFLDEPTNNLDLAGRQTCLRLARRLADNGTAVFAILHDPNDAARYADNVWLLKDGRLFASGPAASVLTAPRLSDLFGVSIATAPANGTATVFFAREAPDPPETGTQWSDSGRL